MRYLFGRTSGCSEIDAFEPAGPGRDVVLNDRLVASGARIGRCCAMITHHEGTAFWGVVRKKFYYGGNLGTVLCESPGKNAKRFVVFKPAYFRNWHRLARHPLLTLGLIAMKTSRFADGALGLGLVSLRRVQ